MPIKLNCEGYKTMTFVCEQMPESAKDDLRFPVAIGYEGARPTLSKWMIDKERDAFMVLADSEGGAYQAVPIRRSYVLLWSQNLIEIAAYPEEKTYPSSGSVMHWRVEEVGIPSSLSESSEDVLRLIKDAFRALGQFFNGEKISDVETVIERTKLI